MEITVAKSAGFCFGVQRAVDSVYKELEENSGKIYTFGPIIHNEQVVEDLNKRGIEVIDTVEQLKEIKEGTVVIRSHGVAKEIYDIVVEANLRGIAAAKPGNRMCDVDLAARNYIEEKGYGKYFTHRTGHSCGLEDHEYGDVSSVNEDIIKVGQCFSVEPGIYLADEGIGVRIEDLVIITEEGCDSLNHFTKDLIIVPEV